MSEWQKDAADDAAAIQDDYQGVRAQPGVGRSLYRGVRPDLAALHQWRCRGTDATALLLRSLVAHGETPMVPKWKRGDS